MYSVVSVVDESVISRGSVTFMDTVLYEVQDAIKLVLNFQSNVSLKVLGCQFDMIVKDVNLPSYAVSMAGGECEVRNSLITMSTPDTHGLSLHSLKRAHIEMSLIETLEDTPRYCTDFHREHRGL